MYEASTWIQNARLKKCRSYCESNNFLNQFLLPVVTHDDKGTAILNLSLTKGICKIIKLKLICFSSTSNTLYSFNPLVAVIADKLLVFVNYLCQVILGAAGIVECPDYIPHICNLGSKMELHLRPRKPLVKTISISNLAMHQ